MNCKATEIRQVLTRLLFPYWIDHNNPILKLSDNEHYLLESNLVTKLVGYWKNDKEVIQVLKPIENESFDCDDFAFLMKGKIGVYTKLNLKLNYSLCFGIAWGKFKHTGGGFHALNWYLTNKKDFRFIEPQNFKIYTLDNCLSKSLSLVIS